MIKLFADSTPRRTRQIVADVLMVAWIVLCRWLGRATSQGIEALRGPADNLASAGDSIRDNMSGAATNVGGVPLVGDSLRGPFDAISRAGQNIANVGASLGVTVDQVSGVAGLVVAAVPILAVLAVWAVVRTRFVRRATAAQHWLAQPGALELFALRGLSRQSFDGWNALGPTRPDSSAAVTAGRCGP